MKCWFTWQGYKLLETKWMTVRAMLLRGYIMSSSAARLTAARRVLTLSLL
jgi:hypothetical protein